MHETHPMASPLHGIAAAALAEHEIVLFFPVDGIDPARGPQVRFGQLAGGHGGDPFPPDQEEALMARYAADPLWQVLAPGEHDKTGFVVGEDLHPHIRDILSGARTDLATRWILAANARRLLASADLYRDDKPPAQRSRKAIVLEFAQAAERRLAAENLGSRKLKLTIESLDLILFSTAKGFAQLRVTLAPLTAGAPLAAMELLEAICAVARFNRLRWHDLKSATLVGSTFDLGVLVNALCLGRPDATRAAARAFTYAFARFARHQAAADADLFALHAARRYTSDYTLAHDAGGFRRVRDFDTVAHTAALEGAVTLVVPPADNEPLPEFLRAFRAGTFSAHYVPIALLALHEHSFLVEQTSTALLTPAQRADRAAASRKFFELARQSLDFRVIFRYAEVSLITMHNALHRVFREMLGLDRMQAEFSADVAEISEFLQREEAHRRAEDEHRRGRRFWYFSMFGTAVLGALAVSTLVKEGFEILDAVWAHGVAHLDGKEAAALVAFAAGMAVFLGACLVGVIKRPPRHAPADPDAHGGHGFADHAAPDFVIHKHRE
jgi:hypothetical protein